MIALDGEGRKAPVTLGQRDFRDIVGLLGVVCYMTVRLEDCLLSGTARPRKGSWWRNGSRPGSLASVISSGILAEALNLFKYAIYLQSS